MSDHVMVVIPNFPQDEQSELSCMALLSMLKPWSIDVGLSDIVSDLKGSHTTWRAASEEYFASLTKKSRLEHDVVSSERLTNMHGIRQATSASKKEEWESKQRPRIVEISWVQMIHYLDPAFASISGFPNGMSDICWNCGRTDLPLKKCSRCKKAMYCSSGCQKQAWWHHNNTTLEHACKKVTTK